MNARERQKRFEEFEAPIKEIALNNPIVNRVLMEYVNGNIVTKDEAKWQMIIALAKEMEKEHEAYMSLARLSAPKFIKP